jgi:phosphoribosylformylglycinamidine synthase II
MNSLHFGPLAAPADASAEQKAEAARNRSIVAGVVRGIGDYGNAFGVPTVGGEVRFGECYSRNPLVNAFTLGILRKDQIFYGRAAGVGNPVIYVGAKTGRDGIHGATMASEEFDEQSESKRPTVQVGDPFLEKLLLEACLEAMRAGAIVGIQDMGAAGLTSSSSEMGARAGTGVEIDIDLVPQRETGMTPYEIMLSESQERMLIVAAAGREREVLDVFKKWELDAVVIGQVTSEPRLVVKQGGQVVADIPNTALTDEAPVYNRPVRRPDAGPVPAAKIREPVPDDELDPAFMRIIASENIASKEWVYRQYDHMVRTNTVVLPGSDAAVIRIKETRRALAMTLDSNARYCRVDPRAGARLVIAEACRNLVASGARPLALTNCLNFGSPERPEVMWQFSETVDGMAEACLALGVPVTGGNVSFYNETDGRGIYPTPVIGMIGIVEDLHHITTQWFKQENRLIVLLGGTRDDLGASEYESMTRQGDARQGDARQGDARQGGTRSGEAHEDRSAASGGQVPRLDLEVELAVQEICLKIIQSELVESAHDCSDGGLAVALAESAFSSYRRAGLGFHANIEGDLSTPALLFSETPSRVVVTVADANLPRVMEIAAECGVPVSVLGRTGGDRLAISVNGRPVINRSIAEVERAWRGALPRVLEVPSLLTAEESLAS